LISIKATFAVARYSTFDMSQNVVTLDVREDLKRGREPFSKIMRTVAALGANEDLLLIAPFEPAPLYAVLGQQGFSHVSKTTPAGDWEVRFSRSESAGTSRGKEAPLSRKPATRAEAVDPAAVVVEVDARGLEPPEPLVKILEALASLPAGARLRARTDRRPLHLYAQLEERGFVARSEEEKDGSFVTDINRA
jgi:uncharacterized protein (DUF2249 family)